MPHHLGLGGCVQAGYKLAYELGFQYVIRVDGDGQHDARDIPARVRAAEVHRLRNGDRLALRRRNGSRTGAVRSLGIASSAWCCGRCWVKRCTIPPPVSWA